MNEETFEEGVEEYFGPDPDYEAIDHKEIVQKLEDSSFLEEIRNAPSWRIFREVWRRIYKQAEIQLDNVRPSDTAKIIELQLTKRFYRDVLSATINKIRADGKAAFEQAKERGFLDRLFPSMKKDL